VRKFKSFNHSACKKVLNLLEVIYLRLRKIVGERVTVVKFGVDIFLSYPSSYPSRRFERTL